MNTLALKRNPYRYEIDGKPWPDPHMQTDYIIDGASMGVALRFESARPWFGQTCFEYDDAVRDEMILQLRGLAPCLNQFGTDRFVLYRCHCGDDYCGTISCIIERGNDTIRWRDVRRENDVGPDSEAEAPGPIPLFEFDLTAYDAAIAAYTQSIG